MQVLGCSLVSLVICGPDWNTPGHGRVSANVVGLERRGSRTKDLISFLFLLSATTALWQDTVEIDRSSVEISVFGFDFLDGPERQGTRHYALG
jgi:hypothetical protein